MEEQILRVSVSTTQKADSVCQNFGSACKGAPILDIQKSEGGTIYPVANLNPGSSSDVIQADSSMHFDNIGAIGLGREPSDFPPG